MTARDVPHCTICGGLIFRPTPGGGWVHMDVVRNGHADHHVAPSASAVSR